MGLGNKSTTSIKPPEFPIPFEGPPIYIILEGRMDRDGSLTWVAIDSCWPTAASAKRQVEIILATKPKVIREQYSKSPKYFKSSHHPTKWEDATGNFLEIQKHEVRIPKWMNEQGPEALVWFQTLRLGGLE